MQVAEAGQVHDPLVHARVVLHRAGPEWVEARVDAEGAVGKRGEVPQELRLRDLRQPGRARTAELFRHLSRWEVGPRERRSSAAWPRLLVDELHAASTSTSRSISAVVRFSVTATSSASSRPA